MSENAFTRWSRRKRGLGADLPDTAAPEGPAAARPLAGAPAGGAGWEEAPDGETLREEAPREETEAEFLERTGLPDPEDLAPGADFSAYLRGAVPAALRRRAMRSLWRSDPVFACLDGLNDYDDDYTGGALKETLVQTAYEVGRGFRRLATPAPDPCDNPPDPDVIPDGTADAAPSDAPSEVGETAAPVPITQAPAAWETHERPRPPCGETGKEAEDARSSSPPESLASATLTSTSTREDTPSRRSRMRFTTP